MGGGGGNSLGFLKFGVQSSRVLNLRGVEVELPGFLPQGLSPGVLGLRALGFRVPSKAPVIGSFHRAPLGTALGGGGGGRELPRVLKVWGSKF